MTNQYANVEGWFLGLDIGRARDYSALSVITRRAELLREHDMTSVVLRYYAEGVKRYPLRTPYAVIEDDVALAWNNAVMMGQPKWLVVDQTGVGDPIVEALRRRRIPAIGMDITSGSRATRDEEENRFNVPKSALVTNLMRLVQLRRFKVRDTVESIAEFKKELAGFQYKIAKDTGTVTWEAGSEQTHDDMVIAVALPLWFAESQVPSRLGRRKMAKVSEMDYDPLGVK